MRLEDIELTITRMDDTFDANFGEWIRNEENARIVGHNLKKYIETYPSSTFIVVVKWIVKDWTLRSIIVLVKKMIVEDIKQNTDKKMEIIQGIVYTWNAVFIAEFMLSVTSGFSEEDKIMFCEKLCTEFSQEKLGEMMFHLESKVEEQVHNVIRRSMSESRKCPKRSINRTLLDAFNIS